jgi:hypothetical protein
VRRTYALLKAGSSDPQGPDRILGRVHPKHVLPRWLLISVIAAAIAAPGVSGARSPERERSPVLVEVRRDEFHWGDAGVGAAAALAIVAIAAGVALVLRDRRDRQSTQDTS